MDDDVAGSIDSFGKYGMGRCAAGDRENRCVHVHTAECYGDADETATMSQTGELEPTECTHVCSVESGCILDTEDLENNDADAWKVGTPSNAEDTTTTGGIVTPVTQTKSCPGPGLIRRKICSMAGWRCTEYVQDEEGRWPLEGTYEFKAELPEGYELAEGVDALVVEVSVAGDQAAVTATPSTYLVITQWGT